MTTKSFSVNLLSSCLRIFLQFEQNFLNIPGKPSCGRRFWFPFLYLLNNFTSDKIFLFSYKSFSEQSFVINVIKNRFHVLQKEISEHVCLFSVKNFIDSVLLKDSWRTREKNTTFFGNSDETFDTHLTFETHIIY
jgi:hypothetical protein